MMWKYMKVDRFYDFYQHTIYFTCCACDNHELILFCF
uniref:Uncharacterized protein n=1 Tax=Rhizophora mucronata TaxID=61149 RepID=A0A2P2MP30_RHIMU